MQTTTLSVLDAAIRAALKDRNISDYATMNISYASGSIVATLSTNTRADARAVRAATGTIINYVQRAFPPSLTTTVSGTAATSTSTSTAEYAGYICAVAVPLMAIVWVGYRVHRKSDSQSTYQYEAIHMNM